MKEKSKHSFLMVARLFEPVSVTQQQTYSL